MIVYVCFGLVYFDSLFTDFIFRRLGLSPRTHDPVEQGSIGFDPQESLTLGSDTDGELSLTSEPLWTPSSESHSTPNTDFQSTPNPDLLATSDIVTSDSDLQLTSDRDIQLTSDGVLQLTSGSELELTSSSDLLDDVVETGKDAVGDDVEKERKDTDGRSFLCVLTQQGCQIQAHIDELKSTKTYLLKSKIYPILCQSDPLFCQNLDIPVTQAMYNNLVNS